jgi:twitching motility protein PilI
MAKRGKNKGKGKPQQAAPAQVAPVESLVAAETLDAEAPADDVEAGSAAAVEAAGADAPADAPIAEEAPVADVVQAAPAPEAEAELAPAKPAKPARQQKWRARDKRSPYLVLAEYEQRSLAHVAGLPEQLDAPGLWRGVAYRIGSHRLASGFDEVVEILSMPAVTPVPGSQPWMLGVANVRGTLLPVVDLKQFLEGERTVLHEGQRVLVVRQPGGDVAVTIEEMYGQRSFVDAQGIDAAAVTEGRYAYFIDRAYRINDQDWGVFSLERLARTPEFRQAAA